MNAYERIGKKLQMAREEEKLSQEELAKKIGCSQAALSNYELGKRRLYLADLRRIGQILRKPVTFFLDEAEEESNEDLNLILKETSIKEILLEVRALKPDQRKSILDYIRWQKSREDQND
jgi:transcriptional regulator with XRE-family HTH domain